MSRFHIMITALFIIGAAGIYLSLESTPLFQNQEPSGLPLSPTPQKKEVSQVAVLHGVENKISGGEANWNYANGSYTFGVRAGRIPQPQKGTFYAAWLIRGSDTWFIGKLEKIETGEFKGDYALGLVSKEAFGSFEKVLVTLEAADDAQPEKSILEGSFSN